MLALSRKKNEAIVINNDIEITVLEVKGDQVKIGITAPKEVPIYRKEVYLQIQEANKAAVDAEGMAALKNLLGYNKENNGNDTDSGVCNPEFFLNTHIEKRGHNFPKL